VRRDIDESHTGRLLENNANLASATTICQDIISVATMSGLSLRSKKKLPELDPIKQGRCGHRGLGNEKEGVDHQFDTSTRRGSRSQAQSETAIANDRAAILKLATTSKNDSGALSSIAIQQKFKEGVTTRVTRNATPTCVDFTFGLDPEEIISRYPLGSFCQNCEWFVQDSQLCQNKRQVKRNSKLYKCTADQ
jgi:hypothetical protein